MTKLGDAIKSIAAEHPHARWYLPMAVGGHLDHRTVKDVAACALKDAGVRSIFFYEELFYAAETAASNAGGELKPVDIKWKLELCRLYWSQFTPGRVQLLKDYAKKLGNGHPAERIWPVGNARAM